MNSTEIIKLRLAELKKMSIELKESTQNSEEVDYELVNDILEATKSSASKLQEMKRLREVEENSKLGQAKNSSSVNNSRSAMPYKALFPQTTPSNNQQYYYHTPSYKQSFYSQQQHPNHHHPTSTYSQYSLTKPQNNYSSPQSYSHYQQQNNTFTLLQNPFIPNNGQYNNFFPQQQQQQQQEFIGQLYPYNHNNDPNYYHDSNQQHIIDHQQVINLKQQNSNLQRTIVTMRHEIFQLRQKVQRVKKQQQWKSGLPYFHLSQQISALYTRLRVNQQDYAKIDYYNYHADLTLQKLTIKKSSALGTGHQKQLHMTDLKQVRYIDSIVMLLQFGYDSQQSKSLYQQHRDDASQNEFEENVFIKFNNEEELHRWDLALYINFNLINSLKKDKLFLNYLKQSRSLQKSRKKSSQSRRRNDSLNKSRDENDLIEEDSDLMKKLIQRRDMYLQTKKLVSQRMIQKVNEKKLLKSSGGNKKISKQQPSQQQFSQTHPLELRNNQDTDQPQKSSKFTYKYQKQETNRKNNDTNRQNDSSLQKQSRKDTSGFNDLANITSKTNGTTYNHNIHNVENVFIPPLNLSGRKNEKQLSFSPMENNSNLIMGKKSSQQEKHDQLNNETRTKQQRQQRLKNIINKFTEQGYDLTKYSKDGFNPHQKRFFLSDDMKKLFWQQQGGKNKKYIDLKAIKQIQSQKIGQGIRKHIKRPKKQQHCIISYVKDNKTKVIQLGANQKVMTIFVEEFKILLEHLKIIKENY